MNVKLVGEAVRTAGNVPVPESAMSKALLDPLTVIERMLFAVPATVGAKTTENVVLWLGTKVIGRLNPV